MTAIFDLPRLPRRPSTLIRLACDDMVKAANTKGYKIDPSQWHGRTTDGACAVCVAGAVMAMSLGARRFEALAPFDFGPDRNALDALNLFRTGCWGTAIRTLLGRALTDIEFLKLKNLDLGCPPGIPVGSKATTFIRFMRKAATKLESIGW